MKTARAEYLILGNSAAAVGAVEGLRRVDPRTPVLLLAREPHHTYSRPLIANLLAGELDAERLNWRPRDFYERHGVEAQLGVEAVRVDPGARTVTTADGGELRFGKLLIATGGRPVLPAIANLDAPGVFTFTARDDAERLDAFIRERACESAVVIGAGLIGLKAAEALHARGLKLLVVELAERVLPLALDERGSELAAAALRRAGVGLECGTTVERVLVGDDGVSGVLLGTGRAVSCDLLVVAVGVAPNAELVRGTALAIDRGILIDERCETNVPGIFAAGDVAQGRDALTGRSRPIPIFPNAYRQGSVAGANLAGGDARTGPLFAMNALELFDLPIISAGEATASGDGCEVLSRADEAAGSWRRLVLRDGRLIGALFVGEIDRAGIFTGLIREGTDVSGLRELLLSDGFGLLSLPAEYRKYVVRGEAIEV